MTIIRTEEQEKGRVRVWLDNGQDFVLYKKEARGLDLELEEETEISPEQYGCVQQEILIPRARRRAMYLLEKMDRTEYQLRDKLKQNHYGEEAIEEAVSYVKNFHYLDDYRYACSYIRCRGDAKSQRGISMELQRKGIPRELIHRAFEEETFQRDESEKILKWLEKKNYDPAQADEKKKQKMYQFLLRKGFSSHDILKQLMS